MLRVLKVLILRPHRCLYIKPWVDLLAGIKDVVWIEDGFGLFEEFKDMLAKQFA